MTGSGSSDFGLNANEFYRLSQLEEAVFLAIRDGKTALRDYLAFMYLFISEDPIKFQSGFENGIDAENAVEMIKAENHVGLHIETRGKGAADYIQKFKKFLFIRGIKVDFRKTPLK